MKNQERTESEDVFIEMNEEGNKTVEIEAGKVEIRPTYFKIKFEGEVAQKLVDLSDELKRRGVDSRTLISLLSDEILQKTNLFWEKWLEEITPGQFYLEAIRKDPELETKLEVLLKQMYLGRGKITSSKKKVQKETDFVEPMTQTED